MAPSDEMLDLLNSLYASFSTGDLTAWEESVAEDVIGVGSDPDEWWDGRATVLRVGKEQVEQMSAAGVQVTAGLPVVVEEGDVVWAIDRPTITAPEAPPASARFTVIATRRDGRLVVRHFHLSVGVSNEEVLGAELPTA
jgi:ketosteroid isomerase-like protein